jgi:hypothetical protein
VNRIAYSLLLLTVACSRTLYFSTGAQTSSTPDVAYICVQEQLKTLSYERLRHDDDERRVVGRKEDPKVHISSLTFRKALDILDVSVHPDASGTAAVAIKAQTLHLYDQQRGLTEEEVSASPQVKADAAHLAQACVQ